MKYFLLTLLFFLVGLTFMAIGVIISNKKLKGSCGGLGRITGEDCLFCGKKDECERAQKDKHEHIGPEQNSQITC